MPSLFIHNPTVPSCVPSTFEKHNIYRERNRLLPILRIYTDLLEYIFLLTTSFDIPSYSQTCHDWRIIAISIRSLWAGLVDFEVNLEAWNKGWTHGSYASSFPCHICRVSSFGEDTSLPRWFWYFNLGHPSWTSSTAGSSHWVSRFQPWPHQLSRYRFLHLTSNLFAGDAPRLKRLDMTQCLVDFQAPVLRSLTAIMGGFLNELSADSVEIVGKSQSSPFIYFSPSI